MSVKRRPRGREVNPEPVMIPRPYLDKMTAILADVISKATGAKIAPNQLNIVLNKATLIVPSNIKERIDLRRIFQLSITLIDPQPWP